MKRKRSAILMYYFITYLFMNIFLSVHIREITPLNKLIFLLNVNIREITLLKIRKGNSPVKRSGLDCTCVNTDYFIARF